MTSTEIADQLQPCDKLPAGTKLSPALMHRPAVFAGFGGGGYLLPEYVVIDRLKKFWAGEGGKGDFEKYLAACKLCAESYLSRNFAPLFQTQGVQAFYSEEFGATNIDDYVCLSVCFKHVESDLFLPLVLMVDPKKFVEYDDPSEVVVKWWNNTIRLNGSSCVLVMAEWVPQIDGYQNQKLVSDVTD